MKKLGRLSAGRRGAFWAEKARRGRRRRRSKGKRRCNLTSVPSNKVDTMSLNDASLKEQEFSGNRQANNHGKDDRH
jgi:hypothetical protein